MKKKVFAALIVLLALVLVFAACKKEVTVTFDTDGGSSVASVTLTEGETVSKPSDPTKAGHTFGGWYADKACTQAFDFSKPIEGNVTVYAKWIAITYQVTFDTDGGLPATWSQEVNEGSEVARPTDPTKSGYTFAGWYSDEACTRAYDFGTKIYQDTTIYAKWTRNIVNYTVKFDTDGGGTISSQTVREGQFADEPTAPTKSGYTFGGWYQDAELTRRFDFDKTPVTADMTIYAKWLEIFEITFDAAGGAFESGESTYSANFDEGTSLTAPVPTRTDWEFVGWYTSASGGQPYDLTAAKENVTLYAYWSQTVFTVKFVYRVDGSDQDIEITTSKVDADNGVLQRPADPSREGYIFDGWFSDPNCTLPYDFDAKVTEDDIVYAGWHVQRTFTVKIDTDGGTAIASQSVLEGETAVEPDVEPEKTGYYFTGWFRDPDYRQPFVFGKDVITGDITVYAGWDSNILVQFDVNGGGPLVDQIVIEAEEGEVGEPTAPTRKGYDFAGWYTDAALTQKATFPYTADRDTNFYAKWENEDDTVQVHFELANFADNEDLAIDPLTKTSISVKRGEPITQSDVTPPEDLKATDKDGVEHTMMFSYWNFSENCKEKTGSTYVPHTEMVLFPIDTTDIDEITLYAVYREVDENDTRATLTIHPNNGAEDTVVYGIKGETIGAKLDSYTDQPMYSAPGRVEPIREGYRVTGYYKTDDLTSVGEGNEENVYTIPFELTEEQNDCYLRWEEEKVIIRYIGDNFTIDTPGEYHGYVDLIENEFYDGRVFDGWYLEKNNYNPQKRFDAETMRVIDDLLGEYKEDEEGGRYRNLVLYAKYVSDPVVMTFDTQGGSEIDDAILQRGASIGELPTPHINGRVFQGWYTDPDCTQSYDADTPVDEDITLYAAWGQPSSDIDLFRFIYDSGDEEYAIALADNVNKAEVEELVLPSTYQGKPVTEVYSEGFVGCTNLKSVVIPRTIRLISREAFMDCTSLKSVTVEGVALNQIGYDAFENCTSLEEFVLDESAPLVYVYASLFAESPKMREEYEEENGLYYYRGILMGDEKTIAAKNFEAEEGELTSLNIRKGTRSIAALAFWNYRSADSAERISSLTVPEGVKYIAYLSLPYVKTLSLPSSLIYLNEGQSALATLWWGIEDITVGTNSRYQMIDGCLVDNRENMVIASERYADSLPDGYGRIGVYAFTNKELDTVEIPSSYYEIMTGAFINSAFTSIVLPDNVGILASDAFRGCNNLTSITFGLGIGVDEAQSLLSSVSTAALATLSVSEDNTELYAQGNILYSKSDWSVVYCPEVLSGPIVIPEGVVSLDKTLFNGQKKTVDITEIIFPDSLVDYPDFFGYYAKSLTKVRIGAGAGETSRSDGAGKSWTEWITTGDLEKVEFEIAEDNQWLSLDENGIYNKDGTLLIYLFINDGALVISDGVEATMDGYYSVPYVGATSMHFGSAFGAIDELEVDTSCMNGVTVSADNPNYSEKDGIVYTKDRTEFVLITLGLDRESVELPKELTTIPERAVSIGGMNGFEFGPYFGSVWPQPINEYALRIGTLSVEEGSQLTSIGDYAFTLAEVDLSWGAPSIWDTYGANSIGVLDLSNATNLQSIGDAAFAGLPGLTEVIVPSGTIGRYAFSDCTGLTTANLNGVTALEEGAFYRCSVLEDVTMPDVQSLGLNVFFNCLNLYQDGLLIIDNALYGGYYMTLSGKDVIIPDTVTAIKDGALAQIDVIESVYIPASVTTVGSDIVYDDMLVYCEAASKPEGWADDWCVDGVSVVWDCLNNEVDNSGRIHNVALEGLIYRLDTVEKTAAVTGAAAETTEVVVPESVSYKDATYQVKSIGESAFQNNAVIVSATIPEGVERIEAYAFMSTANLKTVSMPETLKYVGHDAFNGSGLTSVTVMAGVEYGSTVFNNCKSLTDVTVEDGVTIITSSMFRLTEFETLTLPDSVVTIDDGAFENAALASVNLPSSLEEIGSNAFSGTNLKTIDFSTAPELKLIDYRAFMGTGITEVTLPYVCELGSDVFGNNVVNVTVAVAGEITSLDFLGGTKGKLQSLTLTGEKETWIADGKNYRDALLSPDLIADNFTLTFNQGMTRIGNYAFYDLTDDKTKTLTVVFNEGLTEIGTNTFYEVNFSALELPDTLKSMDSAFSNAAIAGDVVLPDGLESVSNTFNGATVGSLTVNSGLVTIGTHAFYVKAPEDGSTCVTVPEAFPNLTSIGLSAFNGSTVVWRETLTLGSEQSGVAVDKFNTGSYGPVNLIAYVSSVEEGAFANEAVQTIKVIGVGDNVTVGKNATSNMTALTQLTFENIASFGGYMVRSDNKLTKVTLGAGVKEIGDSMFSGLVAGAEVDIQSTDITRIGDQAFYESNITSFTIGEKVESIGSWAFAKTPNLTTVVNNSAALKTIGDHAFYQSAIRSFTISETVESIGAWAFAETNSLSTVTNNSAVLKTIGDQAFYKSKITSFTIGETVESIGAYAFASNSALTSVTNNSTALKSIGNYAFSNTGITSFELNDGLETIGEFAFYNSKIGEIELPSSLTSVGDSIFYGNATNVTVPFAEGELPAGWSSSWNSSNTGVVTYAPASVEEGGEAA